MSETIYVITYHSFNHDNTRPGAQPLDRRFLDTDKNYIFYLIDPEIPQELQGKKIIQERQIDPVLSQAGAKFLAEWAFLLAEEKHSFCEYPFFMISSRFYEKNRWLHRDLNEEWDDLFAHFKKYGWGYLPSYDRPLRWINMEWQSKIDRKVWRYQFFPFTEKFYHLVEKIYGLRITQNYSHTADLFCNYIGFRSRKELLDYVAFYQPLIRYFFEANFQPRQKIHDYARCAGTFRNEKPFTFLLEWLCHLFFLAKKEKYFALHYNAYFEIDEVEKKMVRLKKFSIPFLTRTNRWLRWQKRKMFSEGRLSIIKWTCKFFVEKLNKLHAHASEMNFRRPDQH